MILRTYFNTARFCHIFTFFTFDGDDYDHSTGTDVLSFLLVVYDSEQQFSLAYCFWIKVRAPWSIYSKVPLLHR